ncbi:HvfC family RiPP maturation protein [Neisseria weaveri]|uniref:HvfC family RiPP maturation protein n=1 Tax=Neisseria weaveri TaxID=28091 RepID=UPI000D315220|nr:putative DNA-binding domain-containing protein [Neisseria weaveri]
MQPDQRPNCADNTSEHFQTALANYIRNPSLPAPEGIPAERLAVYVRLVHNNVRNFVELCFSDSREFIEDSVWETLLKNFLDASRPESPFFNDIPRAFFNHVQTQSETLPDYVLEMMDFELALLHAETAIQTFSDGPANDETELFWSPSAQLKTYANDFVGSHLEEVYPLPENEECRVVVWRDRDEEVCYQTVEDADWFLLSHFSAQSDSLSGLLAKLAEMLPGQDIEPWLRQSIREWIDAGLLLTARQ